MVKQHFMLHFLEGEGKPLAIPERAPMMWVTTPPSQSGGFISSEYP